MVSLFLCGIFSSMRRIVLSLLLLLLFSSMSIQPVSAAIPSGFVDQLVADVAGPTALAFTPDGRLLIAQQGGQLRIYQNGSLLTTPALDLSSVICSNVERGLLGIAVDPNFASNNFIYLYYTFDQLGNGSCQLSDPSPNNPVNRVSRFVLPASNTIAKSSEKVILSNIQSNWGNHNAGDLKFGADGYLYITTGDGGREKVPPREISNLNGKILRILVNSDGSYSYSGNPYASSSGVRNCGSPSGLPSGSGACGEVFAHGLRNPFRVAFKPGTNDFYINDVGQGVWEEVNQGVAGADYGWNQREGLCTYPPLNCGNTPSGFTDPIYTYNHNTGCASITGGAFIPQGVWPAPYSGYVYSDYVCGKMFNLTTSPPHSTSEFVTGLGVNSAVTLLFGPYNSTQALYYTNYNNGGQVRRIYYTGATNQPPSAQISASPTNGNAPLVVNFNGSASSDPEGSALTYSWDFGDGQTSNNNTSASSQHTYSTVGTFTAKLVVKDSAGNNSSAATVRIDVGNSPPVPVIISPSASDRFYVGQTVTLQGSATDQQDGTLSASSLKWEVLQHHLDSRNPQNKHSHPYLSATTGNNLSIMTPDMEDLFAHDSYLEIRLTATDSTGLSTTISREFRANGGNREIQANFQTNPISLGVTVNGTTYDTPSSFYLWERSAINVTVPSPQVASTINYVFASWSDGGAKAHSVLMPGNSTTFTANFTAAATSIPLPATSTPTKTTIPVPPTATPLATNTPVVSTRTPTPLPTATNPVVNTPTPGANAQAIIRIEQDTIPDDAQNMTFYSAFGMFLLDDPQQDDGDGYAKSIQFSPAPGNYSFSQSAGSNWKTTAIQCSPAQNVVVNIDTNSVAITAQRAVTVTCTFVTQPRANNPATTPTPKPPTPTATIAVATPTPATTPTFANCPVYSSTNRVAMTMGMSNAQSEIRVTGAPIIADANVSVKLNHSYVGDVTLSLLHVESGREILLMDRPLSPPLQFGCKYDDVVAVFSDEASLTVEDRCEPTVPTINGSFSPNEPLSAFDGISGNGTWILKILDNDPFVDMGTLNEWSLQLCNASATQSDMQLPEDYVPLVIGREAPNEQDKEAQNFNQIFLPVVTR